MAAGIAPAVSGPVRYAQVDADDFDPVTGRILRRKQ